MTENIQGKPTNITLQAMQETADAENIELSNEQLTSKLAFQEAQAETVNPFARLLKGKEKKIESHRERIQKMMQTTESKQLGPIEQVKDQAEQFSKRNPELKANVLTMLRDLVKPGDTKEDILRKLRDVYRDPSLADEALEFLLETTEGELAEAVQAARKEYNEQFGRQILAGRNISAQAREAADRGLGTPSNMRDLYREVTGNPKDSNALFQDLSNKYAYKEMKKVVDFLLHSLGNDLKAKGPSIPRGELFRLITETRNLQAILGVYRFFRNRMPLVNKLFIKEGLEVPSELNFESLTKLFMSMAGERYPSSDKLLQSGGKLGIEKWINAKIIAFSQLRDAIREVAINQIYRSIQHRDEMYLAILEALEQLEDELEELLESEDEEEDEEGLEEGMEKDSIE